MFIIKDEKKKEKFQQEVLQNFYDKMIKIKTVMILGILLVLIGFGITMSVKCSKLERENIKLKLEQSDIVDSIKTENETLCLEISYLFDEIHYYKTQVDSLKSVKQQIIIKSEYIVSEDITEGVELLKDNLK